MARATAAEVDALQRKVERLELNLGLETERADRAVKALRAFYQNAMLIPSDNPDDIELENNICQILGYGGGGL